MSYDDGSRVTISREEYDALTRTTNGMKIVSVSAEAYRVLCGLVQPTDVVDSDDVTAEDATWHELRATFPARDYAPHAGDD